MVSFTYLLLVATGLVAFAQAASVDADHVARGQGRSRAGVARQGKFRHKRSSKAERCKALVTTTSSSVPVATTTRAVAAQAQKEAGPVAAATTAHRTSPAASSPKATPKGTTSQTSQTSTSGGGDDGLTTSQESQFLSLHNSIRGQHGAVALTWNSTLAHIAKGWANRCVFQHSQGALGPFGENLAAGYGGGYDVAQAMKSWTDEECEHACKPKHENFA